MYASLPWDSSTRSFFHTLIMTFQCFLHLGFNEKLTACILLLLYLPPAHPQDIRVLFGELPSHCYALKVQGCQYNKQGCIVFFFSDLQWEVFLLTLLLSAPSSRFEWWPDPVSINPAGSSKPNIFIFFKWWRWTAIQRGLQYLEGTPGVR